MISISGARPCAARLCNTSICLFAHQA